MKIKHLLLALSLIALCSCEQKPQSYTSLNDYPEYKGSDLGVTYTPEKSTFKTWSPAADEVKLNIYTEGSGSEPVAVYNMKYDKDGTWIRSVKENLEGKFYTFQIRKDTVWYDPTPGIWAKAVGINGDRAAIINWNNTNPEGWENDIRPNLNSFTDAIIYEVHVRDMTVSPTSGSSYPGKFIGMTEHGTISPAGLKTGIDHILEFGATHVQILPSYDYGSIDETRLSDNKYNWGYDPKNYNVPEGGYSTDPYNPETRIYEMKSMIQQFHKAGIRVIMDVVYNHTFVGETSHLNLMAPGYFYRMTPDGAWSNGSGCGNETASERAMMRRFMVESVKFWINEYHIDGFRFDLMGIHDIETMKAIRAAIDEIDPSITIHGEGWAAGPCQIPEQDQALKQHVDQMDGIAVFSDDIRDAMRGNWVEGNAGGFLTGNGFEESIKFGVAGATNHPQIDTTKIVHASRAYALSPSQVINYVSCHDDPCVVDKLLSINPKFTTKQIIRMAELGQTIVFTSQGVPFIYAGEEILRNKKGVHNTYQSPDSINQIDWNNKAVYADYYSYMRSLVDMRKTHPAFRMNDAEIIAKAIRFIETPANVVAYTIDGSFSNDEWNKIFVVYNGNDKYVKINLPEGNWKAVCLDGKFNLNGISCYTSTLSVPATSAAILYN